MKKIYSCCLLFAHVAFASQPPAMTANHPLTIKYAYEKLTHQDSKERTKGLQYLFYNKREEIDAMRIIVCKNGILTYRGILGKSKSALMLAHFLAGTFTYDASNSIKMGPRLILGTTQVPTLKDYRQMQIFPCHEEELVGFLADISKPLSDQPSSKKQTEMLGVNTMANNSAAAPTSSISLARLSSSVAELPAAPGGPTDAAFKAKK